MLVDLDFETASAADLKLVGASAYAEDPTTEVLCLVYHIDPDVHTWRPGDSTEDLCRLAADPGVVFVAHNAAFEQAIWHYIMVPVFGLPETPIERWEDTMAMCAWKALPLALAKVALALKLPIEKDMEGNRLTLGMSRVNKKTGMYPERAPETTERIAVYCHRDVAVEGALRKRIGLLKDESPHERGIWLLDQKINHRGLRIDLDFVRQAQLVVDRATVPLLTEFRDLTGVNPGQVSKVIDWCGKQGVQLDNLQKGYLDGLLAENVGELDDAGYESLAGTEAERANDGLLRSMQLPSVVRRVLEIRQMLGSASIKKLARMRACVNHDGRARGLLQYHAASTGLWGGRLLQPQNFPRGTLNIPPEVAVDAIMTGDPEYVEMVLGAPAIECVASSLRHALVADPNKLFMVGDFAGIQARIVLALAGQHDKVAIMASGQDVYVDMATDIYGRRDITKEERQTGKNTVLGCGFQMGPAKFQARYCTNQPIEFAEKVITAYRKTWAPKVPALWGGTWEHKNGLGDVSLKAVQTGQPQEAYGVVYKREGDWLTATLPNRWQKLWYPQPRLFHDERFDKEAWQYSVHKGGKMSQVKAYGGLETQNVVSGLARGLMVASMMRVEQAGMPIVLTVHDEIVVEVDEDKADLDLFETLMAEPTSWSDRIGIPVAVEAWSGRRYKK